VERNLEIAARPVDPVVRVRMMLEAYMRWGLEHPNAYQLVYSAPRTISAGQWPEDTLDLSMRSYEIFREVVREVAAAGRLRYGSADSGAQTLWASCHGLVALLAARPKFPWADRDELIQVTLDSVIAGLVAD
jgi:hypothetical protein